MMKINKGDKKIRKKKKKSSHESDIVNCVMYKITP